MPRALLRTVECCQGAAIALLPGSPFLLPMRIYTLQAEYKEVLNRQVRQAAADASSSSAAAAAAADDAFLQSECQALSGLQLPCLAAMLNPPLT